MTIEAIARDRDFIERHTARARVPFVPEVEIHCATEPTPLWTATQSWLDDEGLDAPFWAFPWAGGQALARYVLDNPSLVRGRAVLDVATGSGLVAIAAKLAGASAVLALDIDPLAAVAAGMNADLNGVTIDVVTRDVFAGEAGAFEVVLAGDVFYDRDLAAALLPWLRACAQRGVTVVVGDPFRKYAPEDVEVLGSYDVPVMLELEGVPSKAARVVRFLNG